MISQNKKFLQNLKFFLIALIFVLILIPVFVQAADKALEIVYPQIPGATTPKTVASGLPEYVDYILKFAMLIIGFVVLGALIFSGIQWLTSTGKPDQLSSAKQGIFSAFLGAIILFSAYLIFNTINPELTILTLPEVDIIQPVVTPGIYLCDYLIAPGELRSMIERYESENTDERIKATQELKKAMIKNENKKGTCFRVNSSANLANFVFNLSKNTIFAIPKEISVFNPEDNQFKPDWVYDYGIIFHQKDNFKGKCSLVLGIYGGLYEEPLLQSLEFKAKSVTIFEKLTTEPSPENQGVILYQCLAYNEGGASSCPSGVTTGDIKSFPITLPGGNITEVRKSELEKLALIENEQKTGTGFGGVSSKSLVPDKTSGTRSIKIDPAGSYFAILFSDDNFTGLTCEVINSNDNNLFDNDIGRCGNCNYWFQKETDERLLNTCHPCLKSMIVVKGKVL